MAPHKHSTHSHGKRDTVSSLKRSVEELVKVTAQAGLDRGKLVDIVREKWTRDALGRPPVLPEKRMSKVIQVRVTEGEYDMLKKKAKVAGVTVSVLLRRTVKRVAR